ncbi:MAG: serine/threonine transporter SstT [Lachnospiraceae bacterium]
MKKLWNKWTEIALVKRILVGLVFGAILGLTVPGATGISILGDVFVSALKAIAPLLVFFLVISSLCNAGNSHGGVIKTVIILYMFSTVLAAVIAVFTSMAFPVKLTLATAAATDTAAPQGIAEVLNNLLLNVVANPVSSLVNANYVGILTWAILLGLAFRAANDMTKNVLNDIANGTSTVVSWIINMAPFGIFGLVFNTVSTNGLEIFTTYGKLLALLVGCMLFIYFVTNPLLVYWCIRKNPYPLIFHCLKRSALTAFFTRSSAANIPVNMKVCEEMGLDRDTYSVTIPLGATINMDGAAITITVMTMATAFTLGIHVDIPTAIILSLLAALSACGASGVAGGSLLLIPMACSLFGISDDISMQVVAVGFIIGVIQDSVETALNSSSDLLLSASAEFRQWRLEGKEIKFK